MRLGAVLLGLLVTGCQNAPAEHSEEYWRSGANFKDRCGLVVDQVRAPLEEDGARIVIFMPFGFYGTLDFYALATMRPSDSAAENFYGRGIGKGIAQVTHYLYPTETGAFMANCLASAGFREVRRGQPPVEYKADQIFSALYTDVRFGRSVAIRAENQAVGILASGASADADLLAALSEQTAREMRPKNSE